MTKRPMGDGVSTLTVMFTDIVGSTELGARLGDVEAKALRRAHDRILTESFERHGARLVESTGDGYMVAFGSAREGVQCAVEIQSSLAREHHLGRYADLSVRIGLHTTEPIYEGGSLFGSGINMAARVGAEAGSGQVLVSIITRLLAEESFGNEPSIRFRSVGGRLLKGFEDPAELFEVQWAAVAEPPNRTTRFVGRKRELLQLKSHLERTLAGNGGIVFVDGDAGVGKTRLVSEFTIAARDRGATVLKGASYESEGSAPYFSFVEALRGLVTNPTADLQDLVAEHKTQLGLLFPSLGGNASEGSEQPAVSQEGMRHRLFESITSFLLSAARVRVGIVLVLDDLQWADDASLLLLEHLSRRCGDGNLLIVTTVRVGEKTREAIDRIRVDAERAQTGATISLQPLDREDMETLAMAVIGRETSVDVADVLFDATQGNPFYLEELVWHLQEEGHDLSEDTASLTEWSIPDRVRNVVSRRLSRLSDNARQMLTVCSVLGGDLTLQRIAAAGETSFEYTVDLIDEAAGVRVLQDTGSGYAFAHPLLREAVYDDLSSGRRALLHKAVGEGLEELYGPADLEGHLPELAEHFVEGVSVGDPQKAFDYVRRAAEYSLSVLAYESAARLFGRALDVMSKYGIASDDERCDLLLEKGYALMLAGEFVQSDEALVQATQAARDLGDPERLTRAVVGHQGTLSTQFDALEDLLEECLKRLDDSDSLLRVRALALLASKLHLTPQRARGEELCAEALDMARRLGDREATGFALNQWHLFLEGPSDNLAERLAVSNEIKEIGQSLQDRQFTFWGITHLVMDYAELGDMKALDSELSEARTLASEVGRPYFSWIIETFDVTRAHHGGSFDAATEHLEEAALLGQKMGTRPMFMLAYGVQQFVLFRDRGEVEKLVGLLELIVRQYIYSDFPTLPAALALIYCEQGRLVDAQSELDSAAGLRPDMLPEDSNWCLTMAILSEVAFSLGDSGRGRVLYQELQRVAKRQVVAGTGVYACLGAVSRYLGLLATVLERWDDAEAHFRDALEANERMGAVPELARTRYNYADMLTRRGLPEDKPKAIELLDAAIATAGEIGMMGVLEKASGLRERVTTSQAGSSG